MKVFIAFFSSQLQKFEPNKIDSGVEWTQIKNNKSQNFSYFSILVKFGTIWDKIGKTLADKILIMKHWKISNKHKIYKNNHKEELVELWKNAILKKITQRLRKNSKYRSF